MIPCILEANRHGVVLFDSYIMICTFVYNRSEVSSVTDLKLLQCSTHYILQCDGCCIRAGCLFREQDATDQQAGVAEHRLSCAGIGDLSKDSWLCKDCVLALCVKKLKMPPLALTNDLWVGRLHPLYHNLNLATIAALSPGRAMMN